METHISKTVEILKQRNNPAGLLAVHHVEVLYNLLDEAWGYVDAGEQEKRESWPTEIEQGWLKLDLGERIRQVLDS